MSNIGGQQLGSLVLGSAGTSSTFNGAFGQAQARIKQTYISTGQSQADIKQISRGYGQANASITTSIFGLGQAQGYIKSTVSTFGQSQTDIKRTYTQSGQAQGYIGVIGPAGIVSGQAQATITALIYLSDTFTRTTNYGTVGSPDVGPAWAGFITSDIEQFHVNGSALELNVGASGSHDSVTYSNISVSNLDYTGEFTILANQASVPFIDLWALSGNVEAYNQPDGTWRLRTNVTSVGVSYPTSLGVTYAFRLQVDSGNAKFKLWVKDDGEPLTWLIEQGGASTTPGYVAIYLAGQSNKPARILIDNIYVVPPTSTVSQKKYGQAQAYIVAPIRHGQAAAQITSSIKQSRGQAQAYIAAQYILLLDTFTRAIYETDNKNQGEINPPDVGSYTTYSAANQGAISKDGRLELIPQITNVNSESFSFTTVVDAAQLTAFFDFYSSDYNTTDSFVEIYASGLLELADAYIDSGTLFLDTTSNSTSTSFTLVDGTTYRMMLFVNNSEASIKIWDLSTAEPAFMLTLPTNGNKFSSIGWNVDAGSVTEPVTVWVDNVSAYSISPAIGQAYGQANAFMLGRTVKHGQARARIKTVGVNKSAQARAKIKAIGVTKSGQSQARIKHTYIKSGQAQALLTSVVHNVYAQSNALISSIAQQNFGQAQALITNPSYLLVDTFTRVVSGGLDTPDIGPTYTAYSIPADLSDASVDGTRFKLTDTGTYKYVYAYTAINQRNVELYGEFEYRDSNDYTQFILRDTVASPFRGVFFETNNLNQLRLQSDSAAGTLSTGLQYFNFEVGKTYSFRFIAWETNLFLKVWETATVEPSEWTLTLSHPNVFNSSGQISFYVDIQASASRYLDNFNAKIAATVATGQAKAFISAQAKQVSGQAQAKIAATVSRFGQAQGYIAQTQGYGQAQALIDRSIRYGQSQAWIILSGLIAIGQAQGTISNRRRVFGQAQADIVSSAGYFTGQAQATITKPISSGQAQGYILVPFYNVSGQSNAYILNLKYATGQAQARIAGILAFGQAQADILRAGRASGLAQGLIYTGGIQSGQANALIVRTFVYAPGQAQGFILIRYMVHGLAMGLIEKKYGIGQAQAKVLAYGQLVSGHTQAFIRRTDAYIVSGQAMAQIKRSDPVGQAQALIDGGRYLVMYNGYHLPGYAQGEDYDSIAATFDTSPPFQDGPFDEYNNLKNKTINLEMKVLGLTYLDVKNQTQTAGTIVRSSKGWTKLYIQHYDKYYTALNKKISMSKIVGESMRMLDYQVEFEAKPWLTSDTLNTISGTGTLVTAGRNLYNGSWTYATLRLTGTDITVSGYTESGEFTGFITVSGTVTDLVIDSEQYEANISGANANNQMYAPNYRMLVGPGTTYFEVTGATNCIIEWRDRWYL